MADHYRLLLDELRQDLASAELAREEVERRCGRIQAAIELLKEKMHAATRSKPRVQATPESVGEPGVFTKMSLPQALRHCLSTAKRPLSKRELMAMLRDGGKPEGNHFSQAVYNALYRLSRNGGPIRRNDDGRWSLADEKRDSPPGDSLLIGN